MLHVDLLLLLEGRDLPILPVHLTRDLGQTDLAKVDSALGITEFAGVLLALFPPVHEPLGAHDLILQKEDSLRILVELPLLPTGKISVDAAIKHCKAQATKSGQDEQPQEETDETRTLRTGKQIV
ncbi:MAG: hypothetical protein VCA37_02460 [Roseibacillus sp.]